MNKPIIRHCYNCKWCSRGLGIDSCLVRFIFLTSANKRLKALLCRYYKQKEGADNEK